MTGLLCKANINNQIVIHKQTTMAAPYDVQTYLLDRANIQDTVTRTVRMNSSRPLMADVD